MLTHPTGLFRDTTFRPLGVLAPQILTRAIDRPRLASAHHKPGRGAQKILKANI